MNLNEQQKQLIKEALKVYWQIAKQRLPPTQSVSIIKDIKEITIELNKDSDTKVEKLVGLTDDQFEKVCKPCDKFKNKCTDAVARKYPGKCDPILLYEKNKPKEGVDGGNNKPKGEINGGNTQITGDITGGIAERFANGLTEDEDRRQP